MSLIELHNKLLNIQLSHLWNQWSVLGVAGYSSTKSTIIDPESLLLYSLDIARYDARLYDEILDWCSVNGEFLSIPRIKSLLKRFPVDRQIAALAEIISSNTRTKKWNKLLDIGRSQKTEPLFLHIETGEPLPCFGEIDTAHAHHGLQRTTCILRGYSHHFPPNATEALILKLRALAGITVRCDIIAALLDGSEKHPSQIARETDYYQKTVQDTISEMVRSEYLTQRTHGREKRYCLAASFRTFICSGQTIKLMPWNVVYELLVTLNKTLLITAQKALSPETALVLCRKEITQCEDQLLSTGFKREALRLPTLEALPDLVGMWLGFHSE